MKRSISTLILFFSCIIRVLSQTKSEKYIIYSDKITTLELQYDLSDEACENTGRSNYISYTIKGSKQNRNAYISFKFGYTDCNNNPKYQQYSIDISQNGTGKIGVRCDKLDWSFEGILDEPFYDVEFTNKEKQSSGSRIQVYSKEPDFIEGTSYSFYGDPVELSVKGGVLGEGAAWIWYENSCNGQSIGRGKSIVVYPKNNSTYYVRAEGTNNTTNCAEISISVDRNSVSPISIIGNDKICFGGETTLTVNGGRLGPDADWIWYEGGCEGKTIGKGNSIKIRPEQSQFYSVRAESLNNKTSCVFIKVNVLKRSIAPDSIFTKSSLTICEGEEVNLELRGGVLSDDAKWKWYADTKFENPIAFGKSVVLKPNTTTTYFVRAEGMCNNTVANSIKITVNNKSIKPYYINSSTRQVLKGEKITLSVTSGSLGYDAHWEWYKDKKGSITKLGEGNEIEIRDWRSKTYYVKAKGLCNETDYVSFNSNPQKGHFFDKIYAEKDNKFFALGAGIGIEYLSFAGLYNFITTNSSGSIILADTGNISINCIGVKGEFIIYPIIKEYLSIGFISNYSLGISPFNIAGGGIHKNDLVTKESILYTKFSLTSELCTGFKMTKLLLKVNRSFLPMDLKRTISSNSSGNIDTYEISNKTNTEMISMGFRFGKYDRGFVYKKGNNFDVTYNLKRILTFNATEINVNDYFNLGNWMVGAGIQWWQHSSFKLQFDISTNLSQNLLSFKSLSMKNASYQGSFIYNINWFY